MTRPQRAFRIAALGLVLASLPALAQAWWSKDWTTRTRVTLNTSAAGVETKESVAGLVVAVRLHSGNFDFTAAKEDGSDLRVVGADDKTPLPFAVERYDGINELALIWVAAPPLLPGSDKNVIHVYAGNAKAIAEPPAKLYASGVALLAHFGEADGGALDEAHGARSEPAVAREPNGLLGTAARLSGTESAWPASEALTVAAGAPVTVAFWIKPDNATSGTLLQWGGLRLALAGGKVAADVGATHFEGGSLPPAAWAHIALTVAGGKSTLYVNGARAGDADAALPALAGPLAIGAGYSGLFDELQVVPAARSADWLRLLAASQGAEAKLVSSQRETAGETGDASPGYFAILVRNLTTDAWVVIAILGLMFVLAAWVMVTKAIFVGKTDRGNQSFLERFRAASSDLLHLEGGAGHANSSLYRLYQSGVRELHKREIGGATPVLSGAALNAVRASVDADLVRESHRLNSSMVLLTIAISGGPFLGLLGTVAGVMITFAAIAAAGDVNVNAIAPGIASALLATVAGLVVAIPALFGYNYLASRIKNISADMQIFVDEFTTRVAELYGAP